MMATKHCFNKIDESFIKKISLDRSNLSDEIKQEDLRELPTKIAKLLRAYLTKKN